MASYGKCEKDMEESGSVEENGRGSKKIKKASSLKPQHEDIDILELKMRLSNEYGGAGGSLEFYKHN